VVDDTLVSSDLITGCLRIPKHVHEDSIICCDIGFCGSFEVNGERREDYKR
jgi:hypothetical protein